MKNNAYILTFILLASCSVLNQRNNLDKINTQVKRINNSLNSKILSYNLKEFSKQQKGSIKVGKINNKLKKVIIESDAYANFQKTIIYFQNEKPILVRKERKYILTAYLTDDNIETTELHYLTDFYVIDWQNLVYEKTIPKEYIPIKEVINKYEIEKIITFIKNRN